MKLIKYYADWCNPCKEFAPIVDKVSKDTGIFVRNVNIDKEHYPSDVKGVPTLHLLDDEDNIVKKNFGVMRENELKDWLKID